MKNVIDPQILVIQKVSTVITRERDVEALLESVLSILESDLGMIRGTFALLYGDTLRIEVSRGLAETEKKLGHYRIGEGITGHVAETGVSHVIPDLRNDARNSFFSLESLQHIVSFRVTSLSLSLLFTLPIFEIAFTSLLSHTQSTS